MSGKVISYPIYMPWGVLWRAYDDSVGAEDSPYGEGPTERDAVEDLELLIAEMEGDDG